MKIKNLCKIQKIKNVVGLDLHFGRNEIYYKGEEYSVTLLLMFIGIKVGFVLYKN